MSGRQTTHDQDRTVAEWRTHYQAMGNRVLADHLNMVAREPRRFTPQQRTALLMTASSRLWNAA